MKVVIVGPGCPGCKELHEMVKKLKESGKIKAEIEYHNDVNELIELGVMGSPALLLNGKVIHVGRFKNEADLLKCLKANKL
jgi:small redox-active disulfide protein 2